MGYIIMLLLLVLLIVALAKPEKVLGFISASNAVRRIIAVLVFVAIVVGLFAYAFWLMDKATEQRQQEIDATPLSQYADSMINVYPNFANNDAVCKIISEDFEKRLSDFPSIVKDEPFHIVGGVTQIAGKYNLMLVSEGKGSLTILCEDLDEQTATKLDKTKYYKVVSGKVTNYEPGNGSLWSFLNLGDIYVSEIRLEEVPDMEYKGF